MVLAKKELTATDFEAFINLPENAEKHFEFIGGEIIEMPSNLLSSYISALIIGAIVAYLRKNNIGFVTGEAGGYKVGEERYAPDVAFISKKRQATLDPNIGYNDLPPELAVEVISPTDKAEHIRIKVFNYLAVGTTVWVVSPENKQVEVYIPSQSVKVLDENGVLDGGEILPDFKLPVRDIFPQEDSEG